jgi:hypothetical protein
MKTFKTFLNEDLRVKNYELDPNDPLTPFYYGIVSAEHRGKVKDPTAYDPELAIRTKARHKTAKQLSTAYGPLQITGSTMKDALKRNPQFFNSDSKKYGEQFVAQASKFAKAKQGDKTYDYGKAGDLSGQNFHGLYQQAALGVMKSKFKDASIDPTKTLSPEDETTAIRKWRGVPEEEDPKYYATVRSSHKKYKELAKQDVFNRGSAANQQATADGLEMEDDYLKTRGYAQSPTSWSDNYSDNYNSKMEPSRSDQQSGLSSQTTPERRQPSTLQTAPSRPNNSGGRR